MPRVYSAPIRRAARSLVPGIPASSLPLSVLLASLLPVCALPALAQRPPEVAGSVSAALGMQGRLMWIDGTANLVRKVKNNGATVVVDYSTTREGVAEIVRRCKAAHINTLVVDVKPLSGQVLYNSKIAPRMREWRGRRVPEFDVLAAFIEEGHKAGLQVDAAINTLSEGHKYFKVGPAYEKTDWQSLVYTVERALVAPNGARLPVHVSGEPDDSARPAVLTDESAIMGSEPSAMTGLETIENGKSGPNRPDTPLGKQLHVTLDTNHRVTGLVDGALLGDDPLIAPTGGHVITAIRDADRAWINQNLKAGAQARFDLRAGRTPIAQAPSEKIACFVNVLHPAARKYALDIVREIVTNYDIDGFVLDRCRYASFFNDFSDRTRDAFFEWMETKSKNRFSRSGVRWPEDVFAFAETPGDPILTGPLYKPWLEFRAQVMRDFVAELARIVRSLKPQIALGTYVGSWYPKYYEVGVNWGSDKTSLRYSWFTPDYPRTGYIEFFDWIATGCYYAVPTRYEARRQGLSERATVEYASELSSLAVASGAFVYPGIMVTDYAGKPEAMVRALETAAKQAQGWMIFDLTYIEEYGWWPHLERMTTKEMPPPHAFSELLPAVRAALDSAF